MVLKWLLVRRITLVAIACFLAGSALALCMCAIEAKQQNSELADLAVRQLHLQLVRIDHSTDIPKRFPDWDLVASFALQPGQCLEFRGVDETRNRASCAGVSSAQGGAPDWFAGAYGLITHGRLTADRPLVYRDVQQGVIVAHFDPAATSQKAWETIAPLMSFSALLVSILCLVAYFVVDRALQPTQQILLGLNRLAQGDLACRLPAFRLAELNRISQVFNSVSEELEKSTSERTELARRLVDLQESERRHIARELHDEIAQKLAALNALAACIRTSAKTDAPALVGDACELEKMASGLMVSLRQTLTYLRPQEIDDLGLVQSLKALIDEHNESARGHTTYSIETNGEVERLRAETSAHVYRIVQEALTNASKHANARNVTVSLTQVGGYDHERIRLSVVDDGAGLSGTYKPPSSSGAGLIGMRERVAALSGKLAAGPLPAGGFGLQVEFPIVQLG